MCVQYAAARDADLPTEKTYGGDERTLQTKEPFWIVDFRVHQIRIGVLLRDLRPK